MDVDPELEVDFLGDSDSTSDPKSPAKPIHNAAGAETTNAVPRGNLELRAVRCSAHPTSMSTRRGDRTDHARIRMMRVINMRTLVIVMIPMTLRGVIAAVAIPVIAAIVAPVFLSALRKRSRIVTRYALLLRSNYGCHPYAI